MHSAFDRYSYGFIPENTDEPDMTTGMQYQAEMLRQNMRLHKCDPHYLLKRFASKSVTVNRKVGLCRKNKQPQT